MTDGATLSAAVIILVSVAVLTSVAGLLAERRDSRRLFVWLLVIFLLAALMTRRQVLI